MGGKSAALKLQLKTLKPLLEEIIYQSSRLGIECRHANMLRFMLVIMTKNKLAKSKLNECYTLLDNLLTIYSLFESYPSPSSATFRGRPAIKSIFDPDTRSCEYRISVNHEQLINSVGITVDTMLENFDFESIVKTSEPTNNSFSMAHNAKSRDWFNQHSSKIPRGYEKYFCPKQFSKLERCKLKNSKFNFRWAQANELNSRTNPLTTNIKLSLLGNSDLSWLKYYKIPKVTQGEKIEKSNVIKDQKIRVKEFAKKFDNVNFLINLDENEMINKNQTKRSTAICRQKKDIKTIIENAVKNLNFDVRTLNEECKKQHPKYVHCLLLLVKKKVLNNPSFGHLVNVLTDNGKLHIFKRIYEDTKENTNSNIEHISLENPEADSLKCSEVESQSQEMESITNAEHPGKHISVEREPGDNHSVNLKLKFEINNDKDEIKNPSVNTQMNEELVIENVISHCQEMKPILKVEYPNEDFSVERKSDHKQLSNLKRSKSETGQEMKPVLKVEGSNESFPVESDHKRLLDLKISRLDTEEDQSRKQEYHSSKSRPESSGNMRIKTELNTDIENMDLFHRETKPVLKVEDTNEDFSVKRKSNLNQTLNLKKSKLETEDDQKTIQKYHSPRNQQESSGNMQIKTELNTDFEIIDLFPEPFNIKSEDTEVKSELDEEMYT